MTSIDDEAAADEALRADNRLLLEPLIEAGIGTSDPLAMSVTELAGVLRGNVAGMTTLDPLMSNLLLSTAGVLETLNTRVRTLWEANAAISEV